MIDHSFSIGLGDMVITPEQVILAQSYNTKLENSLSETFNKSIHNKIKLAPGQTNEQGFEGAHSTNQQSTQKELQDIVMKILPRRNALL